MKKFIFYWFGGKPEVGYGTDVAEAFTKLGYSAGALAALDCYEECVGNTQKEECNVNLAPA